MPEIVKKQVCECKNCGNEAEMVVTCKLEEENAPQQPPKKLKGTGVCSHCGNEAEMWIEL